MDGWVVGRWEQGGPEYDDGWVLLGRELFNARVFFFVFLGWFGLESSCCTVRGRVWQRIITAGSLGELDTGVLGSIVIKFVGRPL